MKRTLKSIIKFLATWAAVNVVVSALGYAEWWKWDLMDLSFLLAIPTYIVVIMLEFIPSAEGADFFERKQEEQLEIWERQNMPRPLYVIGMELTDMYTSLGWKYKRISDFCYDHPEYVERLKETDKYKTWRTDVIDWAVDNISRLEGFYFSDGSSLYIDKLTPDGRKIVDLYENAPRPQNGADIVVCEIDFKKTRLPKDYYEFPNLVWEDEDDDYSGDRSRGSAVGDALAFGMGIGLVNGLTGDSISGGVSGGN